MADANRNTLHKSGLNESRQQRGEQPQVPGATGAADDDSPKAAQVRAKKSRGKTEKHTSDDTPVD
jgi:hypothetical protein